MSNGTNPTVKWCDDAQAVATLREFDAPYAVQTIKVSDIDFEASCENHARLDGKAIDEHLVAEYAVAMENGDTFPRTTVFKRGKKYTFADGNHRGQAAQLYGVQTIEAYVVETTDKFTLDVMPRVFNRRGGRRSSSEEQTMHALHAINQYGMKCRQAAQLFGLSEKSLNHKMQAVKTKETLVDLGFSAATKLGETALKELATISDNHNILRAAAPIAASAGMRVQDTREFVKKIKDAKTEASKMAVVAEYEQIVGSARKSPEAARTRRLVRAAVLRHLTGFQTAVGKAQTLVRLQITDTQEQQDVKQRLLDVAGRCRELAKSAD